MIEPLDSLVVELLHRAEDSRASPSELMKRLFAEERLRPRQQKRVRDLFHHALSVTRLIDHAIVVATPGGGVARQLVGPVRVLMARVLAGDLSPKAAERSLSWVDWKRVARLPDEVRALPDPVERLALLGSIPDWLARRFHEQFGAEADPLLTALTGRAPVVVRANTLRCTRERLAEKLAADKIETRPTRFAAHGLEVTSPAQLFRTAAFRKGWFEMQDEASQLVAEVVAPPPGGIVVDACAGAGGKTLALAALLDNRGSIVALDTDPRRLGDLRTRTRRAGVHNARALRVSVDAWPAEVEELAGGAHRILVDAPCSGLGSLRRNPDMRQWMSEDEVRRLRGIQVGLLSRAATRLGPRARVIYATCTVLGEENESVVEEVQERVPGLEPVPVVEILGGVRGRPVADASGTFLKTLPHRHGTDGFFAAVLRRR